MKTLTITFQRENGSTYDFSSRIDDETANSPARLGRRITQIEGALHHRQSRRLRHCVVDPATGGVRSESSHALTIDELPGLTDQQRELLRQATSPGKLTADELRRAGVEEPTKGGDDETAEQREAAMAAKIEAADAERSGEVNAKLAALEAEAQGDLYAGMSAVDAGTEMHRRAEAHVNAIISGEVTPEPGSWDEGALLNHRHRDDEATTQAYAELSPEDRAKADAGDEAVIEGAILRAIEISGVEAEVEGMIGDPDTNNDGLVSLDEIDAAGAPMTVDEAEVEAAVEPIAPERAKAARRKPKKD